MGMWGAVLDWGGVEVGEVDSGGWRGGGMTGRCSVGCS